MQKPSNHRMRVPKNLQLNDLTAKWYYQEMVIRFGEYKSPIMTVKEVAAKFHLPWYDVVRIVSMDKHHTFLQTDGEHVWAVNRCCKVFT